MNNVDLQQSVLGTLESFSGSEPMKKLFWSTLNYNRANKPITRRGWADGTAALLHEDPLLLATGGSGDDFQIVYSRLAENRLLLGGERPVVSRLLKDHPYSLFLFSDKSQTNWHFVNVRLAEDVEKRKLFRRVTVGPNEKMRTASQVVSQLDLSSISPNLFGLSPLKIQERHDQAFDVEPVTEEFFKQYHLIFERVEKLIKGIRDNDQKRLFTQKLFNRLMFIAFIQKKGWMKFAGKNTADYLNVLWSDYQKNGDQEMGFYYERLETLFFKGLAGGGYDIGLNKINKNLGGLWRQLIGDVPPLNGGLFEDDEEEQNPDLRVPDEAIRLILHGLFDHFNFTVTEATPLDVEVAVDPEMLGKVFEELVTGRHETGSYYTPKPIVSFMCREALKGHLESQLPSDTAPAIASFVDDHDPRDLKDAEKSLEALRRIRVCDPACGSGAYLLGMMHELIDLRRCLFKSKNVDSITEYQRKLEIIQRNLYGVDIDPFAVNIARLRLWLSLAVEFEGEHPEPLPNLKFEIEEGDSLSAPGPEPDQGLMREAVVRQFRDAKAEYIKAHGDKKYTLEKTVLDLKASIASWTHKDKGVEGFDWPVEFAEVFDEGGFDVIVANPPYVRQELIKERKPVLQRVFPYVYSGKADLYVYFYARAVQLLRHSGMIAFISSNKWFLAGYGKDLRQHIAKECRLISITDFGELPVFRSAATWAMIFVGQKAPTASQSPMFTQVRSLDPPYPDLLSIIRHNGIRLSTDAIDGSHWSLIEAVSLKHVRTFEHSGVLLRDYIEGEVYSGIKTGLNEAFWIDAERRRQLIAEDKTSADIIKPLARGDEIRKWHIEESGLYIIYVPPGLNINKYPAVKAHLKQFRSDLEKRAIQQPWWELQQAQNRQGTWQKPKIVFPFICKESRFTLDRRKTYVNMNCFLFNSDDSFLLGVLNTQVVWWYLQCICATLGDPTAGGRLQLKRQYIERIPIPNADGKVRSRISALAERCLDASGVDCSEYEEELESLVVRLYGVDPHIVKAR